MIHICSYDFCQVIICSFKEKFSTYFFFEILQHVDVFKSEQAGI